MTEDPVGADWPAWSPDRTKIAYQSGEGGYCCRDLFVLDVAAGTTAQLVDGEASADGIQFTPDGSSLVYRRS